jgi:hypothetical protein
MAPGEQAGEFLMKASRPLALAIAASLAAVAFLAPAISRSLAQVRMPAEPDMPMGWNCKNLSPEQQQRMLRFSAFVNRKVPEKYLTVESRPSNGVSVPRNEEKGKSANRYRTAYLTFCPSTAFRKQFQDSQPAVPYASQPTLI